MKRYGFLSIALAAAITLGCNSKNSNEANSANPPAGGAVGTAGSESVKSGDKDFVHDLAIANTAEVELGRMAAERAANPEVKQFAQMMVDDHTKANTELMAIASQHNVPAPNELDDKHRDLRDKLAKYQGMEFDREYIDAMVDGHGDVVDKLGSRVDKETLDKWKSESKDAAGNKLETKGQAVAILPEKSDDPVTTSINQWAATTYPVASAHLDAAKTLKDTLKKRSTN